MNCVNKIRSSHSHGRVKQVIALQPSVRAGKQIPSAAGWLLHGWGGCGGMGWDSSVCSVGWDGPAGAVGGPAGAPSHAKGCAAAGGPVGCDGTWP